MLKTENEQLRKRLRDAQHDLAEMRRAVHAYGADLKFPVKSGGVLTNRLASPSALKSRGNSLDPVQRGFQTPLQMAVVRVHVVEAEADAVLEETALDASFAPPSASPPVAAMSAPAKNKPATSSAMPGAALWNSQLGDVGQSQFAQSVLSTVDPNGAHATSNGPPRILLTISAAAGEHRPPEDASAAVNNQVNVESTPLDDDIITPLRPGTPQMR